MALVRILVDGYSLLHGWPELAPGKPRHSAEARDELVYILTRYHDAVGTPITIFFDGGGAPPGMPNVFLINITERERLPLVVLLFRVAGVMVFGVVVGAVAGLLVSMVMMAGE